MMPSDLHGQREQPRGFAGGRTLPISSAKAADVVREVGARNAFESAQPLLEPALVGVDVPDMPCAAHALALGQVDRLVLDVERVGGACQQLLPSVHSTASAATAQANTALTASFCGAAGSTKSAV